MLINSFIPNPDAVETHQIAVAAPCETVYRALWTVDLGDSPVIRGLMALRSLPERLLHPQQHRPLPRKITLHTLMDVGFGLLSEEPGREIVLGVTGRFWRPLGNVFPFNPADFQGPVRPGSARAVWNFAMQQVSTAQTLLSTETRVVCGDRTSQLKFRAYWLLVRPFSGLIRILVLRTIRQACEGTR